MRSFHSTVFCVWVVMQFGILPWKKKHEASSSQLKVFFLFFWHHCFRYQSNQVFLMGWHKLVTTLWSKPKQLLGKKFRPYTQHPELLCLHLQQIAPSSTSLAPEQTPTFPVSWPVTEIRKQRNRTIFKEDSGHIYTISYCSCERMGLINT